MSFFRDHNKKNIELQICINSIHPEYKYNIEFISKQRTHFILIQGLYVQTTKFMSLFL